LTYYHLIGFINGNEAHCKIDNNEHMLIKENNP